MSGHNLLLLRAPAPPPLPAPPAPSIQSLLLLLTALQNPMFLPLRTPASPPSPTPPHLLLLVHVLLRLLPNAPILAPPDSNVLASPTQPLSSTHSALLYSSSPAPPAPPFHFTPPPSPPPVPPPPLPTFILLPHSPAPLPSPPAPPGSSPSSLPYVAANTCRPSLAGERNGVVVEGEQIKGVIPPPPQGAPPIHSWGVQLACQLTSQRAVCLCLSWASISSDRKKGRWASWELYCKLVCSSNSRMMSSWSSTLKWTDTGGAQHLSLSEPPLLKIMRLSVKSRASKQLPTCTVKREKYITMS